MATITISETTMLPEGDDMRSNGSPHPGAAAPDNREREEADKHLAQMEGRYRGLLEAAPDAMVVVNQAGEIVLLNLQAEKRFGYRRDELLGQKVTQHHSGGFRGAADRGRPSLCGRCAGAADWHGDRADGAAQRWQRVPDRAHAEPAGKRRRHPGDGGNPRQCAGAVRRS